MKIIIETELDDELWGFDESYAKGCFSKQDYIDLIMEDTGELFTKSTKWTLRYKGVKIEDE